MSSTPDVLLRDCYLEGPIGSGKTTRLIDRAVQHFQTQPTQSVLILCSNHVRQEAFQSALLARLNRPMSQLPVYTFSGFVRNTLFNVWPLAEAKILAAIPQEVAQPRIRPVLSGMEDSELILNHLLAQAQQQYPAFFMAFPGGHRSLVKQLIRRIRLRSENHLTRSQMTERSQWLEELCQFETAKIESDFDRISYKLRVLDANKQQDVFHNFLVDQQSPDCQRFQQWLRTRVQHLIVDDVDETTPAQQALIRFLAPTLETLVMAADPQGGSRRGYLNAYPEGWEGLKALRANGAETQVLSRFDATQETGLYQAASTLFHNWLNPEEHRKTLPGACVSLNDNAVTRAAMLDTVLTDILANLAAGTPAGEIAVVLPKADLVGLAFLQNKLAGRGVTVQLLSGTKRPSDNPLCRAFLYLMQLVNSQKWQQPLSLWEYKTILTQLLQIPMFDRDVFDSMIQALLTPVELEDGEIIPSLSQLPCTLSAELSQRYQTLYDWLVALKDKPFETQFYSAFQTLIVPLATEADRFGDLNRILQSYFRQHDISRRLDLNFDDDAFSRLWLTQAKTGAVSDTAETPESPDPKAIVIATPQKIIDVECRRQIQFWLDVGSREWSRTDNAPLYHAWVHSARFNPNSEIDQANLFSDEFSESQLKVRAAHITRTLMLLATRQVRCYASDLDDFGDAQQGNLKACLLIQQTEIGSELNQQPEKKIVLRDDQAPALQYTGGTMAISAVPGAGKTFVNVELITHLIQQEVVAADQILVLTFMESAAQTLQSRVKKRLRSLGLSQNLPTISTIHSLALKMLMEGDHARRVALSTDDLEIADEFKTNELINRITQKTKCDLSDAASALGYVKTVGITPEMIDQFLAGRAEEYPQLRQFNIGYRAYLNALRTEGLIDFDMLIQKAIALLESHADIRTAYQQKFKIIIEDEAQDSSGILQRFIGLLTTPGQTNLIRTGDTNQSINSTFTSAEPEVFRRFIQTADRLVEMDQSGRCAKPVIQLANQWMQFCLAHPVLKPSFQKLLMKPVAGQNPELLYPIQTRLFETSSGEEFDLVTSIQEAKKQFSSEKLSIAVLVSSHSQVNHLTDLLQKAGIAAVGLTNMLKSDKIFKVLLAWLRLLDAPLEMDKTRAQTISRQLGLYEAYVHAGLLTHQPERREFLERQLLLFQSGNSTAHLDQLQNLGLAQLYYDGLDFSRHTMRETVPKLLIKMTHVLFNTPEDRSNGYLCALLAEQILNITDAETHGHFSPLEVVLTQFEQFVEKDRKMRKGFTGLLAQNAGAIVQVMTLHKAKGQEFDLVWMPYIQEEMFRDDVQKNMYKESHALENQRLKMVLDEVGKLARGERLSVGLFSAEKNKALKMRLREEAITEKARLFYVGVTRAKRGLFLSAHQSNDSLNKDNKPRGSKPALAFHMASQWTTPVTSEAAISEVPV